MKNTEYLRVQSQRSRARSVGTPATLALSDWEQTLADFKRLCAYCQENPFDVLEHFAPVAIAGTTVNNCIPACFRCNYKKSDNTGEALIELFGQATIDRISQYLASRCADKMISPLEVQRKERWHTHPKRASFLPAMLEEKEIYSIRDLCENLTVTLADVAREARLSYKCVCHIIEGERVTQTTANKFLSAMSNLYKRSLSLENVADINVYVARHH